MYRSHLVRLGHESWRRSSTSLPTCSAICCSLSGFRLRAQVAWVWNSRLNISSSLPAATDTLSRMPRPGISGAPEEDQNPSGSSALRLGSYSLYVAPDR